MSVSPQSPDHSTSRKDSKRDAEQNFPLLFKCYGISYSQAEPQSLYPLARCFGFQGRQGISPSVYYVRTDSHTENSYASTASGKGPGGEVLKSIFSHRDEEHSVHFTPQDKIVEGGTLHHATHSPMTPTGDGREASTVGPPAINRTAKSIRSIDPKLDPFAIGPSRLAQEDLSSPNPLALPRPVPPVVRTSDLCLGLMTIGFDAVIRCRGLGIEVVFEEPTMETSTVSPTPKTPISDSSNKTVTRPSGFRPQFNQEMVPPSMEALDQMEGEDKHSRHRHIDALDDDGDEEEEGQTQSTRHEEELGISSKRFSREEVVERFRTGVVALPRVLWKVGDRAASLSKMSCSVIKDAVSTVSNKKVFVQSTYQRLFDIEMRSMEICRRAWACAWRWWGLGGKEHPPP